MCEMWVSHRLSNGSVEGGFEGRIRLVSALADTGSGWRWLEGSMEHVEKRAVAMCHEALQNSRLLELAHGLHHREAYSTTAPQ